MPQNVPVWAKKSSKGGSKGKTKQDTYKGKFHHKGVHYAKGQGKFGIKKGAKGKGKRGKQDRPRRKVSPVSRANQPAFQTNLANRTSRKSLQPPPEGPPAKRTRTVPVALPMAGMPVPPSKCFGNSDRMRSHHMKTDPINLEAGNFDIHKRTVTVKGRPVQCLQVSHQEAKTYEFDGYLPWLMRPVPVQAFQGYTAYDKDKPKGSHAHEVVVNWWQVCVFLYGLVMLAWF